MKASAIMDSRIASQRKTRFILNLRGTDSEEKLPNREGTTYCSFCPSATCAATDTITGLLKSLLSNSRFCRTSLTALTAIQSKHSPEIKTIPSHRLVRREMTKNTEKAKGKAKRLWRTSSKALSRFHPQVAQ